MPQIVVLPHSQLCPEGAVIEAQQGDNLCEILLQNEISLEHACDFSCACTTCHVIIREGYSSLNPADDLEDDQLDKAWGLTRQSGLSCQVVVAANNLIIELPQYTINHARE